MYHLKDRRFGCKRCRYKFGELTGTYLVEFYFSLDILAHLLYLYALGVPAYGIRFYVQLSLTTIEKTFRIFTQSIYNESLLVDIGKKNVDGDPKVKAWYLEYMRGMARSSQYLYLTENAILSFV